MNFASPYIELPKKLTVRQNLEVYARLYGVKDKSERIEELINDQLFEPGHHSIIWNAGNNASGIYFVKFMGGQTKVIKKITLLK